ncbi:hypothetical protein JFU24_13150 [Peribacillus sp. TH27]|nr:hypothetical protein [Peribacillus sp. TH27]
MNYGLRAKHHKNSNLSISLIKIPMLAIATPRAGKPARNATGSITAPSKATAGEGQKNQDIIIMTIPIIQKASVGFLMNLANGAIMTSLIPDFVKTVLMATMIEIIIIVDINSVIAKMKLLNIPLMDEAKLPVATKAKRKIPTIQMRATCLL